MRLEIVQHCPRSLPLGSLRSLKSDRLLAFFILGRRVVWRHCHDVECEPLGRQGGVLILMGDAFPNFMAGMVISAFRFVP